MPRIIIFGDLHANWEALLALQMAEPKPDLVFFLGDAVGYGPDPKRCLDAVQAGATHSIGGRHDRAVGAPSRTNGSMVNQDDEDRLHQPGKKSRPNDELLAATWAHARSVLSSADCAFLADLPAERTVEVARIRFHLTRLPPDDPETETSTLITMSQARLRGLFERIEADVILVGGPHMPAMRQLDERLIVCPGSLGQPRYGVSDPTFAAWQDGRVQIHHLHYKPDLTAHKLSLLPMDPEHVLQLQSILHTGGL